MRDFLSIAGSLLMIVLVIALTYYASRWYARRMSTSSSGKYVKVLDKTPLGVGSALIVAQAGEKYFLIAVSDKNVQLLCALDDFEKHVHDTPTDNSNFTQILSGIMAKIKPKDNGGNE